MTVLNLENKSLFGTSGSGHQRKVWVNINGTNWLVKLNSKYREANKEVSVSKVLSLLNIPHALYIPGEFAYNGKMHNGCMTKSYINGSESVTSLYNVISDIEIKRNESAISYFNKTVNTVENKLGIPVDQVSKYILTLMALDYIFLNPDRHLSNIEFIIDQNGKATMAPYFDFGRSFLGRDGMISQSQFKAEEYKFKSRPFSTNPEKNLISIEAAKSVARVFEMRMHDISALDIPEFHKYVIKKRVGSILQLR